MNSWHDLSGHVALVTGGNSGIGLGMARGLRDAGAAVAIWGTSVEHNEAATTELGAGGGAPVAAFRVDVSDEDAVAAGLAQTLETFGRIDSCFANAGVPGQSAPIDQMSTQDWRRVMSVNLDGQFYTVRAVAGHMKSRGGGGSIVFTSSVSMTDGLPFDIQYAAAKAGLTAMARGLAVELARDKIRVNAIVPGWTEAAMTEGLLST
ncbi:MAG: SDR family NAD(P)-dependent oxidoreductase, partial [Mycobacterium sp.]